MGLFGIGKPAEHHEEPQAKSNFFSKILAGNKHPHDPEAPQHDKKQEHQQHAGGEEEHRTSHEAHKQVHWFVRILHRIELFLRICTLMFLVAGVVVLAVDQASNITTSSSTGTALVSTLKILDIASYKYILAAIIIGQTYIIVQIVVSLCRMVTGISRGFISLYFDFLGDKMLSYLLATGAAAAYGASVNMEISGSNSKGKTAANLVLIAFFFSAISSVISSHSLPKHPAFL